MSKVIFQGIFSLLEKNCGCKIKSYVGGKVVIEGCKKHKTIIYYKCPSCGKKFYGIGQAKSNGKKEMKKHLWDHAI